MAKRKDRNQKSYDHVKNESSNIKVNKTFNNNTNENLEEIVIENNSETPLTYDKTTGRWSNYVPYVVVDEEQKFSYSAPDYVERNVKHKISLNNAAKRMIFSFDQKKRKFGPPGYDYYTIFNGKEQRPKVSFEGERWDQHFIEGIDYVLEFKGDLINPGRVMVKAHGVGEYDWYLREWYYIEPTEEMKKVRFDELTKDNPENPYTPQYEPMKTGSKEWYLYHSRDNEHMANPGLALTLFLVFVKGGIFVLIVLWLLYFLARYLNNQKLNDDPLVIRKREEYKEQRKKDDARDPKYKEDYEFYKDHPERIPGSYEWNKQREIWRQQREEERYKSL